MGLGEFLTSWSWRPEVVVVLVAASAMYLLGMEPAAGPGQRRGVGYGRLALYLTGIASLALALLSPLDTYADRMFSLHMTQHEVIYMVAAPLLLLANPFAVFMWSLPPGPRHALGRLLRPGNPLRLFLFQITRMPVCWTLAVVLLWSWHVPAAYNAALRSNLVHNLEHISFFVSALLLWWPVINPVPRLHGQIHYGLRLLYLVPTLVQNTVLGAYITLSDSVLYSYYTQVPPLWGMDPVEDQQAGGLIMWVMGDMMYLLVFLVLVVIMLERGERQERERWARRATGAVERRTD